VAKVEHDFGIPLPNWQEGLKRVLAEVS